MGARLPPRLPACLRLRCCLLLRLVDLIDQILRLLYVVFHLLRVAAVLLDAVHVFHPQESDQQGNEEKHQNPDPGVIPVFFHLAQDLFLDTKGTAPTEAVLLQECKCALLFFLFCFVGSIVTQIFEKSREI